MRWKNEKYSIIPHQRNRNTKHTKKKWWATKEKTIDIDEQYANDTVRPNFYVVVVPDDKVHYSGFEQERKPGVLSFNSDQIGSYALEQINLVTARANKLRRLLALLAFRRTILKTKKKREDDDFRMKGGYKKRNNMKRRKLNLPQELRFHTNNRIRRHCGPFFNFSFFFCFFCFFFLYRMKKQKYV